MARKRSSRSKLGYTGELNCTVVADANKASRQISQVVIANPDIDAKLTTFSSSQMVYYFGGLPIPDARHLAALRQRSTVSINSDGSPGIYNITLRINGGSVNESLHKMRGTLEGIAAKTPVIRQEFVSTMYSISEKLLRSGKVICLKPRGVIEISDSNRREYLWAEGYPLSGQSPYVEYLALERRIMESTEEMIFEDGIETSLRIDLNDEAGCFSRRGCAFIDAAKSSKDDDEKLQNYRRAYLDYERAKLVVLFMTRRMRQDSAAVTENLGFFENLAKMLAGQAHCVYSSLEVNMLFGTFMLYIEDAIYNMKRLRQKAEEIMDIKSRRLLAKPPEHAYAQGDKEDEDELLEAFSPSNPINMPVEHLETMKEDAISFKRRMRLDPQSKRIGMILERDYLEEKIEECIDSERYEQAEMYRKEVAELRRRLGKGNRIPLGEPDHEMMSVREKIGLYESQGRHAKAALLKRRLNAIERHDPLFLEHPEEIPYSSFFCYKLI